MPRMTFADAIERAVAAAMASDERVVVFGEDVRMMRRNLAIRFGSRRVRNTPIKEGAPFWVPLRGGGR
jgi:pyruvate/2-oxoglutarate/acetoin dehydrogenase E1 component